MSRTRTLGVTTMSEPIPETPLVQDEYELWKKNCRYMYEFVLETALTWPSLTVQWLPQHSTNADNNIDARVLLGTHTLGQDQNYLKIASTELTSDANLASGGPKANARIKVVKKFANDAEINRGRVQPQDPNVIATINGNGEIDVYNTETDTRNHFIPHTENGYGLSWNRHKQNWLLSGSDDRSVAVTDTSLASDKSTIVKVADSHTDIVNDVLWHYFDADVFGSVSDDKTAKLWDLRTQKSTAQFEVPDSQGINTIGFLPFSHNLFAVGNASGTISVFDRRKPGQYPLHSMMGHSEAINMLEFSPHNDGIIALGSLDRRVIIWDLFKIGEEQQQEDAEDGAPELFMMHAGHTAGVTDLLWCPYRPWTLASVADDNVVHLWQVGQKILNEGSDDAVADDELE